MLSHHLKSPILGEGGGVTNNNYYLLYQIMEKLEISNELLWFEMSSSWCYLFSKASSIGLKIQKLPNVIIFQASGKHRHSNPTPNSSWEAPSIHFLLSISPKACLKNSILNVIMGGERFFWYDNNSCHETQLREYTIQFTFPVLLHRILSY